MKNKINRFQNINLKLLIIPTVIITIITVIFITLVTTEQYKKLDIMTNERIAIILGKIKEKYPQIDSKEIIRILELQQDSNEFKEGIKELEKYGISIDTLNSIESIQSEMKNNIKTNICIILLFNLFWSIIIFMYLVQRDKKINQITKYINEIRNKNYKLNIEENSEDELSNLKNELYKITIMLKEESENSKKDKENLKVSVQDISHQLKTPLTSISIMLDNIKEDSNMNEEIRQKFIFQISKQIEWINWLVISMLKLSKLDANVVEFYPEKINVREFISEIIKNLEIPIEIKNQNILIEGNETDSFIGDYKWQQEAITNIIKNCIEHNGEGKKIVIKYLENNLYTKISIKDEGDGISQEDMNHIFERFYKGKNSSENSVGIGLSLSKKIIEKESGMINCNSEENNGTEFVIKYMKNLRKEI